MKFKAKFILMWILNFWLGFGATGVLAATPIYLTSPQDAEGFDFEALRKILDDKPSNIEKVLSRLPVGLRSQAIIMYESRSLQEASPENPRIILFNNDASFAMTFNGDASQKGFQSIETYQFDIIEKKFEFREIHFNEGWPSISKVNPAKCLECHQAPTRADIDPRPNWEPYSVWKGALGSISGKIHPTTMIEKERPILNAFLKNHARHPRYQFVNTSFYEQVQNNQLDESVVNLLLGYTQAVNRLAHMRVTRLIRKSQVPSTIQCRSYWNMVNYLQDPIPKVKSSRFDGRFSALNFFDLFGEDTSDWSLDFHSGGRDAAHLPGGSRFHTPQHPEEEFLAQVRAEPLPSFGLQNCGFPKTIEPEIVYPKLPHPGQKVLNRCVHCHVNEPENFPPIEFKDTKKILERIRLKQMPPNNPLSDEEIEQVTEYLETFNSL